jgi:hypothetical protein
MGGNFDNPVWPNSMTSSTLIPSRLSATGAGSSPAGSREEICRINAARSPRENAPGDQLAPDDRLPGTAAPTLDIQGEER